MPTRSRNARVLTTSRARNAKSTVATLAICIAAAVTCPALGADGTWTGAGGDNLWSNPLNWTALPGVANGTFTSPDVATFDASSPAATIAVDPNRNVAGLTYSSSTASFTLGNAGVNAGPALYLTNGGLTQLTSAAQPPVGDTGKSLAIDAPTVLAGNAYTLAHNSSSALTSLLLRGGITAGSGGATVLTLDGTHLVVSETSGAPAASNARITGAISNGASGTLGIVKQGSGWWELRVPGANPNTYSGDTVINAGVLRISASTDGTNDGLGGLSANSNYIINAGGTLRVSLAGNTARSVTLNTGGILNASTAAAHTINLRNNNGFGLTLNYATSTSTGDTPISLPVSLTGTVAGQGGVRLIATSAQGFFSIGGTSSAFDLGSVMRPFEIGDAAAVNSYDLRTRGPLGGGGPNGGIIKTGAGTLRIDNPSNPFTGTLEIREGEVRANPNASNTFTGKPTLLVNGGAYVVTGGQQMTFSAVTVTKGGLIGSNSTSNVLAPSYVFNPIAGDTLTISAALGDAPSTSAGVTKTGAGIAVLSNPLTYTGQTVVSGGTLQLNENAHTAILGNSTPATTVADVRTGRLVFDYTGNPTRATTVVPLLQSGYAGGFATGPIRSTTATSSRGLGYLDDTANSKFIVAAALYGDSNLDGTVNFADLVTLAQNYNLSGRVWSQGDSNYDGSVNFADLVTLAQNYNQSIAAGVLTAVGDASAFTADWALAQSLVPEPTSLAMIAGVAGLATRRRQV